MSDKLTLDDSDEAVALQLTPKMKELQKKDEIIIAPSY
jgi:hypothetical protein